MRFSWKRSQEGYLLVDHRMSPGITDADLQTIPASHRAMFQSTRGLFEAPTMRCGHCGTMVVLSPTRQKARNYCQPCDHYICDNANCVLTCTPLGRTIERNVESAIKSTLIKEI